MNPPPKRAAWFRYADSASLGIEIAASVSICALGGRWLEREVTHWSPWTTLICIGIGMGAATRAIVRTVRNYQRQLAADRESSDPPPAGSTDDDTRSG